MVHHDTEQRVAAVETEVGSLRDSMEHGFDELGRSVGRLANELAAQRDRQADAQRVSWPLIVTIVGVLFAGAMVMVTLIALVMRPVIETTTTNKAEIRMAADERRAMAVDAVLSAHQAREAQGQLHRNEGRFAALEAEVAAIMETRFGDDRGRALEVQIAVLREIVGRIEAEQARRTDKVYAPSN